MNDKIFVGRAEQITNKFGGIETRVGYTKEHLDALVANLNEKGWVNTSIRTSKEGKPYQEIYQQPVVSEATPF
jgi:hypothetical protein